MANNNRSTKIDSGFSDKERLLKKLKDLDLNNKKEVIKLEETLEKARIERLDNYKRRLLLDALDEADSIEKDQIKERAELERRERLRTIQEEQDGLKRSFLIFNESLQSAIESTDWSQKALNATRTIANQLDSVINEYVSKQQSISAHLAGSNRSLESLTDTLQNALTGTPLVRQQAVFNNMGTLVKEGIISNVEQRAFLQTLSDDLELTFKASNDTLTRLVRIQEQDSSANRLALEFNLQRMLNEQFQNSEYIRDSFQTVTNSIFEMQSLLTPESAYGIEATLQSILGSYYTEGASSQTIASLASAFNALGSGDISGIGQGTSNLVLMGVARSGLDYGEILTRGVTAEEISKIMSEVFNYLGDISDSSNVVKSQLGKLFGVSVSDIVAAQKMGPVGSVSTDISGLLSSYESFTPFATQMSNFMSNFMFTMGTNIASNPLLYGAYKLTEIISSTLGPLVTAVDEKVGTLVKLAPLASIAAAALPTLFSDGLSSISASNLGFMSVFDALLDQSTIKVAPTGVSQSMYVSAPGIGQGGLASSLQMSTTQQLEEIGISGDEISLEDNVLKINNNVETIVDVLTNIYDDMSRMFDILERR